MVTTITLRGMEDFSLIFLEYEILSYYFYVDILLFLDFTFLFFGFYGTKNTPMVCVWEMKFIYNFQN